MVSMFIVSLNKTTCWRRWNSQPVSEMLAKCLRRWGLRGMSGESEIGPVYDLWLEGEEGQVRNIDFLNLLALECRSRTIAKGQKNK